MPIKLTEIGALQDLKSEYEVVFHLAAKIPFGQYNTADKSVVEANVMLTHKVCTAFPNAKIIYASSVSVYGYPPQIQKITESTPFDSPSLYGLSKIAGEYLVRNHPSYAIIRYTSLYGKGMYAATILPIMAAQAKDKRLITIWGKGERKQDFIHISDAARLTVAAAEANGNEVYLGVSGKGYSNLEVAQIIQQYTGCNIEFQGEDNSPSFEYDASFTHKKLSFNTKISLFQGIKDLL